MNRDILKTIILAGIICCGVLALQAFRNARLAERINAERAAITQLESELGPKVVASVATDRPATSVSSTGQPTGQAVEASTTADSSKTIIEDTIGALQRLVADVGDMNRSPAALFKLLPDILRAVEPLSLDELMAVAEGMPGSFVQRSGPANAESAVKMILYLLAAESDPRRVMQNKEFMANGEMNAAVIGSLARRDSAAALRYLKTADISPQQRTTLERGLIMQTLRRDVHAGLRMMEEMAKGGKIPSGELTSAPMALPMEALPNLIAAREAPENASLREIIDNILLSSAMFDGGVARAREVAAEARLDDVAVASALGSLRETSSDPGALLDWMAEVQTPEEYAKMIGGRIRQWAMRDFNAAGEWLGNQEPGPAKDQAIKDFARTVAPVDGGAAAVWASLIEDPSTREEALRSTIKEWQAKDRPAAETWVKEQGLDPAEFGIGSK